MNGCVEYTKATVELYFPNGNVCCALCPMLGGTERRPQCNRTGEYIVDTRVCGMFCKLNFVEEENV